MKDIQLEFVSNIKHCFDLYLTNMNQKHSFPYRIGP